MEYFGAWAACLVLSSWLGKEIGEYVWSIWDDEIDDPPTFPLLEKAWPVWRKLDGAWFWLWVRCLNPLREWGEERLPHWFPPSEPPPSSLDADGRTPEEWLAIELIGIWNLEVRYKGEYDWQVKRNWDECLNSRHMPKEATPNPLDSDR